MSIVTVQSFGVVLTEVPCKPEPKVYDGIVLIHRVTFLRTPEGMVGTCQDCGRIFRR